MSIKILCQRLGNDKGNYDNPIGRLRILLRNGINFPLNLGLLGICIQLLLLPNGGAILHKMSMLPTIKTRSNDSVTGSKSMIFPTIATQLCWRLKRHWLIGCCNPLPLIWSRLILLSLSMVWRPSFSLLLFDLPGFFCPTLNELSPIKYFKIVPQHEWGQFFRG